MQESKIFVPHTTEAFILILLCNFVECLLQMREKMYHGLWRTREEKRLLREPSKSLLNGHTRAPTLPCSLEEFCHTQKFPHWTSLQSFILVLCFTYSKVFIHLDAIFNTLVKNSKHAVDVVYEKLPFGNYFLSFALLFINIALRQLIFIQKLITGQ